MSIRVKSASASIAKNDGLRVLVDRHLPTGLTQAKAKISLWLKDAAPSAELDKWYALDPTRWDQFVMRYYHELDTKNDTIEQLMASASRGHRLTLVYANDDPKLNTAQALRLYLQRRMVG
jgi:uncharacterized protein YeaO (DUF488 family)